MTRGVERALFWIPRALAIAFAAFLAIFALDVFDGSQSALATAGALLIHLVPSALVLLALWLAWRREVAGGLMFVVLGAAYLIPAWDRFPAATYAAIAGPLALVGAGFIAHGLASARR
ncbi:MAG: hypothetical protein U9Q74_06830 [Gemmatimonadota bacterium]|nr:hypothetical protein [Gemmatimonadota bacterium]